jgi:hypothetical protein
MLSSIYTKYFTHHFPLHNTTCDEENIYISFSGKQIKNNCKSTTFAKKKTIYLNTNACKLQLNTPSYTNITQLSYTIKQHREHLIHFYTCYVTILNRLFGNAIQLMILLFNKILNGA